MIVACPECGKRLRINSAASKRIKCPGCSAVFAAVPDEADDEEPRTSVARAASRRRPEVDEDDDDRDPDRPRSRGRQRPHEEEAEEEEDDRPRRRKSAAKSRRSDDDDDDDDPRPRRKKRKKQGSSALMWLIVGGVGFLVAAIVGVVVFLAVRGGGSGAYPQHEAAANELVGLMKELQAAFESVQDANTARTAATRINSVVDRFHAVHQRMRSLGKITAEENRRLQQKVQSELMPLQTRMHQAALQAGMRCQGETTFIAAAKRLETLRNLR
jgi:hypothetical protein